MRAGTESSQTCEEDYSVVRKADLLAFKYRHRLFGTPVAGQAR
jgi:hypothetical protein